MQCCRIRSQPDQLPFISDGRLGRFEHAHDAQTCVAVVKRYLAYELGKERIRVNAISAGPIKTLAARGIAGFGDMLREHEERAPLGRRVEIEEVGSTGVFLASNASSGITGEVIYVDCGYNIMGF